MKFLLLLAIVFVVFSQIAACASVDSAPAVSADGERVSRLVSSVQDAERKKVDDAAYSRVRR